MPFAEVALEVMSPDTQVAMPPKAMHICIVGHVSYAVHVPEVLCHHFAVDDHRAFTAVWKNPSTL